MLSISVVEMRRRHIHTRCALLCYCVKLISGYQIKNAYAVIT